MFLQLDACIEAILIGKGALVHEVESTMSSGEG